MPDPWPIVMTRLQSANSLAEGEGEGFYGLGRGGGGMSGCFDLSGLHGSPSDRGSIIPADWVRHQRGAFCGELYVVLCETSQV